MSVLHCGNVCVCLFDVLLACVFMCWGVLVCVSVSAWFFDWPCPRLLFACFLCVSVCLRVCLCTCEWLFVCLLVCLLDWACSNSFYFVWLSACVCLLDCVSVCVRLCVCVFANVVGRVSV